jgi:LexA-binding, inner membrane-associated putative hydrolase
MIIEHIFYSAALAILAGMVFFHFTGRDPSWIIILSSFAPDLDYFVTPVLNRLGIRVLLDGSSIHHGTFHTIAFMVVFGIAMAFLLHPFGLKFLDSILFSLLGSGAHLVEDALVYASGYRSLWPFSSEELGFGLLPTILNEEHYIRDFFRIANSEVLIIGLLLLLAALLIRTCYERSPSWVRFYLPASIYRIFF